MLKYVLLFVIFAFSSVQAAPIICKGTPKGVYLIVPDGKTAIHGVQIVLDTGIITVNLDKNTVSQVKLAGGDVCY